MKKFLLIFPILLIITSNLNEIIFFGDKIYVSTEESEIKKISLTNDAIVIDRPNDLAQDTSSYLETVQHLLNSIPEKNSNPIIILLETTSPMRSSIDIENCICLMIAKMIFTHQAIFPLIVPKCVIELQPVLEAVA